ncbi:MAG: glutamine--fructose-6-phosphate transaminase (isomerizing), partial [Colwellia sp.]|nr:glutamine--fructose-6-phosphate transaminase (isomerizing) [Colwellia sp.]
MCGIVGAVAQRDVAEILVEGLRRLEYRGYDSAGIATVDQNQQLASAKRLGKVQELAQALQETPLYGGTGIAHTRWATHGAPSEVNAHPHFSNNNIAVVHNGIIENHQQLRNQLQTLGYQFTSQTDTEVIGHLVHHELKTSDSLLAAVQKTVKQLEGAYGTVVMDSTDKERIIVARSGSPLVIGYGLGENFIASDMMALLPVTRKFAFLEEGDVAEVTRFDVNIFAANGAPVERESKEVAVSHDSGNKGEYRHFMLKETYEQPIAIRNTLEGRLVDNCLDVNTFGLGAEDIFKDIEHVQIVACGTSYHSGMVARYWLEALAGVSCNIEIASEFRYRKSHVPKNALLVTISQSGETADTLAALRLAKELGYKASLTICNVDGSSLVRESDLAFMTKAGVEIGVASTKAFTTQLVGLMMMTLAIGKSHGMSEQVQTKISQALLTLPSKLEEVLALAGSIEELAEDFADKHHALFLGRGDQYPIAMEGALKL